MQTEERSLMKTAIVELPEDILTLLAQTRLGDRPQSDQVRIAVAIHLFQEGIISVGKAAELAGEPRIGFEHFLAGIGIAPVQYDEEMYAQDLRGIAEAERRNADA
jgi:predicted HTH domain antitoxin